MARTAGALLRLALALVVYPHELVHYLVLAPWSDDLRVEVAPSSTETSGVPLARLGGRFDPSIPLPVLRLAAVAPTLWYPLVAVGLGLLDPPTGVALGLTVALALWASPSTGDLAVFVGAARVRTAGDLDTRGSTPRFADPLSAVLTVVSTSVVAAALLL